MTERLASDGSALWADYLTAHPEHAAEDPPVDRFGDSPAMADELIDLVLAGTKRATAGLLAEHELDGDVPAAGGHWIATDGSGTERAILLTTEIRIGRVDSVDEAFAFDEGEGDRTRDSWLDGHGRYFERQVAKRSIAAPDGVTALACVFERFAVVWPPDVADDRPAGS